MDWYRGEMWLDLMTPTTKDKYLCLPLWITRRLCVRVDGIRRDGAHGDGKAVPRIDSGDSIGQVDELVFGEFLARLLVEFVGRVVLENEGQGFSPGQGGAFARSEEWRFAPGIERVKTHLRIAGGASVFRMHIDAIGAAVDLRGAQFDQMKQLFFEAAGLQVFFKGVHRVQRIWGIFVVSNARFHEWRLPSSGHSTGYG